MSLVDVELALFLPLTKTNTVFRFTLVGGFV